MKTSFLGGNILFVGHASTLDLMVLSLKRLNKQEEKRKREYVINQHLVRVPYCALGCMVDQPFTVVPPPCPPCVNTSCGRFNWKILLENKDK